MSSSAAGKTAVLQNIHGTMEFLRKYPPFNQMEHSHLAFLVEQCQLRFYASGESIVKPADGPVERRPGIGQGDPRPMSDSLTGRWPEPAPAPEWRRSCRSWRSRRTAPATRSC